MNMNMHNPPHPGGMVRRQCLEPLDMTVTQAASNLGVARQAFSEQVSRHAGTSEEMANLLSKGIGSSPEVLLGLQMSYDQWQAQQRAGHNEV